MPIDVQTHLVLLDQACERLRGPSYCSAFVVQSLAAVARHETCFNECKPFQGTNNYGAIQCGVVADKEGRCPAGCIPARDTSPTSSGASIAYLGCFKTHSTPEEGALAFVKLMTVQRPLIAEALPSGDALQIAWAMRKSYYFEGFGPTEEIRVKGYATAMVRNAESNAREGGFENVVLMPPPPAPSASVAVLVPAPSASGQLVDPDAPAPAPGLTEADLAVGLSCLVAAVGAAAAAFRRKLFSDR